MRAQNGKIELIYIYIYSYMADLPKVPPKKKSSKKPPPEPPVEGVEGAILVCS